MPRLRRGKALSAARSLAPKTCLWGRIEIAPQTTSIHGAIRRFLLCALVRLLAGDNSHTAADGGDQSQTADAEHNSAIAESRKNELVVVDAQESENAPATNVVVLR